MREKSVVMAAQGVAELRRLSSGCVERFMVRAGVRCFCKGQLLRRGLFIKVGTDYKMLKWTQGIVELYACDAIAGNWLCCAAASCQTPGKLRCEKKSDTRFC